MKKRVYPSITFANMKLQDKIANIQILKCVNKTPIHPSIAGPNSFREKKPNPSDYECYNEALLYLYEPLSNSNGLI